jgi:hypothetical protein
MFSLLAHTSYLPMRGSKRPIIITKYHGALGAKRELVVTMGMGALGRTIHLSFPARRMLHYHHNKIGSRP